MNGSPPRVARGRCTRCLIRRYPRQEQHHQKSHRSASGLKFEVAEAIFVLSSDTELVFADDQRFRGPSPAGTGHNINGVTGLFVILPVIPTHERQLRFAGKFDGERLELVFDNPAFGTAPATWRAESLPQTKTNGSITLTLQSLILQPASESRAADDWIPRAAWKIAHDGEEADSWYSVRVAIADESGNASSRTGILSEPIWRLRSTLSRTGKRHHVARDD